MNKEGHDQLIQLARDWVVEHSPEANILQMEISGKTHLLESGALDSLGLVDLLAFLEMTTGMQIDLLEVDAQDFATLDGLCRAAMGARQ